MKQLSKSEIGVAKTWLYDLFKSGGIVNNSNPNLAFTLLDEIDSKQICDEIVNRNFNFKKLKLDDVLVKLSLTPFKVNGQCQDVRCSADQLIDYIGWFCINNNIIWDDSLLTPQERTEIESTKLGKGLLDWGCFKSTQTGRLSGHSGDIPNLISTAGQKVYFTSTVYCIEADPIGKNVPYVFITPFKTDGHGNIITVSKADAEKIHFSAGNGYTDCTLWFATKADAISAYNFCVNTFGGNFSNIHIAQTQANKDGYYLVSTDLGSAWVSAKKLNEELDEVLKYEKNPAYGFKINNIDLYDKWMHISDS